MKRTEKEQTVETKKPLNREKIKKVTINTVVGIVIASASFTVGYLQPQTKTAMNFSTNSQQTTKDLKKLSKVQQELGKAKDELETTKYEQMKAAEERKAAYDTSDSLKKEITQQQQTKDSLNAEISSLQQSKQEVAQQAPASTSDHIANAEKAASPQGIAQTTNAYFMQATNSYHALDSVDKNALSQFAAYQGPAWNLMQTLVETKRGDFNNIKDEFVKSEFCFGSNDEEREGAAHALYQTVGATNANKLTLN